MEGTKKCYALLELVQLQIEPYLHSQDPKDDEEGAADEDDVTDGFQRAEQRLNYKFEPRRSVDDPEGPERPDEPEHPEDAEDL